MHQSTERRNTIGFLWHAVWLALATTFTEINTVLPGLIVQAGGRELHVGILTGIMVGIPLVAQLVFAGFLARRPLKRPFLIAGIYLRVLALAGVAWTLTSAQSIASSSVILLTYFWMILFASSGAFAGVSYTDILGKSIDRQRRRRFFIVRQYLSTAGILASALVARLVLGRLNFPANYRTLFALAAGSLAIASAGFWALEERPGRIDDQSGDLFGVLRNIPRLIRSDSNLRNYIAMVNLAGFGTAVIPFFMVLAQRRIGITGDLVGVYLLIQIVGMLLSNLLWQRVVRATAFRGVLLASTIVGTVLPIAALLLVATGSAGLYGIVFFLSGAALSARRVGQDGAILEMTTEQNRALYAGVTGALSLTVALFPLAVGGLIVLLGYVPIMVFAAVTTAASAVFIYRLDCSLPPSDR
jgi:hypothetical protein